MVHIADVQNTYAMVIGAVLVLVGIIGFVQAPIFGLFGVNTAQNVLHLVGGAVIVWFGYKGSGKTTNMWLGYVSGAVGILGFVPGVSGLLTSWFAINTAISVLHIAIGAVSLGVSYGVKEAAM